MVEEIMVEFREKLLLIVASFTHKISTKQFREDSMKRSLLPLKARN